MFVNLNGPTVDEMNVLDLKEIKSKKVGPVDVEAMQTDGDVAKFFFL